MKKSVQIPLLLFTLTLFFFYKPIFIFDQIVYPAPDILYATYIEKTLFSQSINAYKTLPLWNPYVFGGSPFLGNPTSTMFYPFNLLFLLLPVGSAFGYMFAIDSFLIGVFTYLYTRVIKIDRFGSLVSAITIMFSGPMMSSVFAGHPILSDTFIWFPLALLFFELMIKKRKIIFAIMTGLAIALMFFAGSPQTVIYEILSLSIYFILRSIPDHKSIQGFLKLTILPATAIAVGILIACIQLLPSFEFSKLSQRGSNGISYAFAADFSLHPYQTLSFIFPYFFGFPVNQTYWAKGNFWELNGYIGVLPFIFTFLTLFIKKNKYVLIFLAVGLFSLLHAFGKYSFVFPFFFNYVPGFDNFRVPARFLFIYVFSFSILSGIGASLLINNLINRIKIISRKITILIPITLTSLICFLLLIGKSNSIVSLYEKYVLKNSFAVGINHSLLYDQTRSDIIIFLASLAFLSLAIFLANNNIIKISQAKIIIILLIVIDLWLFGSKLIDTRSMKTVFKSTDIISKILTDKTTYRILDMKGEYTPLVAANNLESVTGVQSLYLKNTRDFLWSIGKHVDMPYDSFVEIDKVSNPIFLNLLNVKYIISNSIINKNGLSEIMKSNFQPSYFSPPNQSYHLYENKSVLPRAYVVPNALVIDDKQKTLDFIASNNFDPKRYVILEKLPKNTILNNDSAYKEVKITRINFNQTGINLNLSNPGFLVLSEIYYPGWKAYDNGKEIEILKANFVLRTMFLGRGQHHILLKYNPNSYKIGLTLSLTTLFLSLLYIFIYVYKQRPKLHHPR